MSNRESLNITAIKNYFAIASLGFALGGLYLKVSEGVELNKQVASSLNKTNKQLLKKGVIDDADFVLLGKPKKITITIKDNIICKGEDDEERKRITNSEISFDELNYKEVE